MKLIRDLTILFLIIWFSLTIMVITHESWHVFQFSTQESEIYQICFLGYMKDVEEINGEYRNLHIFGWVWADNPHARVTEWDAWYIGLAVMLVSVLGLEQVIFSKPNNTQCFGTKEFSPNQKICRGCDLYKQCKKEFNKNHVRY